MAKQDSTQRFVGRIGDLIYYKRKGQYLVRKANCPSSQRIKASPEFARTRKLNLEFGAAAKIGKDFRLAISALLKPTADPNLCGRLQGLLARMIHQGSGETGSRPFEVLPNKGLLKDFYLSRKPTSLERLSRQLSITCCPQRKGATLTIPALSLTKAYGQVTGVSHAKVNFSLFVFSNYVFNTSLRKYEPLHPSINGSLVTVSSSCTPIHASSELLQLTASLPSPMIIPETAGVIALAGIDFFKEEGEELYSVDSSNVLKIADVF